MPFVGIAVIGSNPAIHAYDDRSIKIKDGNALVTLALCTSQEGIHVVNRIDGKSPKHFYMPLGYDLENPTCDEDGLPRQDISQKR